MNIRLIPALSIVALLVGCAQPAPVANACGGSPPVAKDAGIGAFGGAVGGAILGDMLGHPLIGALAGGGTGAAGGAVYANNQPSNPCPQTAEALPLPPPPAPVHHYYHHKPVVAVAKPVTPGDSPAAKVSVQKPEAVMASDSGPVSPVAAAKPTAAVIPPPVSVAAPAKAAPAAAAPVALPPPIPLQ
jgi:hypothetical protein